MARRASAAEMVFLAVKPGLVEKALESIRRVLAPDTLIVSIAAGIRLAQIARHLESGARTVRAMPNTPGQIGQGMTVMIICRKLRKMTKPEKLHTKIDNSAMNRI